MPMLVVRGTATMSVMRELAFLAGRTIIAAGLIPNGLRKIATFAATAAMMGGAPPQLIDGRLFPAQPPLFHFPVPEAFLAVSISLDLVGALLVIAGLRTRAVAAVLAGYCILAMAIYHGNVGGPDDVRAILRNLPLVGGFILLAAAGGGAWSVEVWLARRATRRARNERTAAG